MTYYAKYVGIIVLFWLGIQFVQTYEIKYVPIDNEQMSTRIEEDSRIWVHRKEREPRNQLAYGDVVYFIRRHSRFDRSREVFLGRIVAFEGERVALKGRHLFRSNSPVGELKRVEDPGARWVRNVSNLSNREMPDASDDYVDVIVPKDHLFLLVDRRDYYRRAGMICGYDSRFLGPIHHSLVLGKVGD